MIWKKKKKKSYPATRISASLENLKLHSHLRILLRKALGSAKCLFILLRLRKIYVNVVTHLRFP